MALCAARIKLAAGTCGSRAEGLDELMNPLVAKFLDLIAWSEGTSRSPITQFDGYDVIVSGVDGPEIFHDFACHPFEIIPPAKTARAPKLVRAGLYSTAAGRYQLLRRYWDSYKKGLHLPDFSPPSQDAVAVQQLKETGAYSRILASDIPDGIAKCSNIWASLPGNDYGQNAHSIEKLMAHWDTIKPNGMEVA